MGASGSSPFPAAESVPRSFAPRAELSPRRAASSCTITSWAGAAIDGARAGADPELARRRHHRCAMCSARRRCRGRQRSSSTAARRCGRCAARHSGRALTAMADPGRAGRLGAGWPPGAARWVLIALPGVGVTLRLVAIVRRWPTTPTRDDGCQVFAESNPFADPLLRPGTGCCSARSGRSPARWRRRSCSSTWRESPPPCWCSSPPAGRPVRPGLRSCLPRSSCSTPTRSSSSAIMSETSALLVTSAGLYRAVRTLDEPAPLWRWPLATRALLALAVTIRTAGLLVIPVVLLALLLARPGPLVSWPGRWGAPVVATGTAAAILFIYAARQRVVGECFGVSPSPGWYLYGRVAQFADCERFTPTAGTEALCDSRPSDERPGAGSYLFNPEAPAPRVIGGFGEQDDLVGEWANRALRAQPLDFAVMAWEYLPATGRPPCAPSAPTRGHPGPPLRLHFREPLRRPCHRGQARVVLRRLHGRSVRARTRLAAQLAAGGPLLRRSALDHHAAHAARPRSENTPLASRSSVRRAAWR
jgi:hypothetical protein